MTATTITPTAADTIRYEVTLTSPLHHGAGSDGGNTSLLRMKEVIGPDGEIRRIPFLSANSVRHGLRSVIAWHTAHTLGIEDRSLSKGLADLLWTGGGVTETGAETNLELASRADRVYPALGLFGYAARSDIHGSTLRVSDLDLVCAENTWRMPDHLTSTPHAEKKAAKYTSSNMGTRHDIGSSPVTRLLHPEGVVDSKQMIYDLDVLAAGTRLYGTMSLTPAATEAHRMVLGAALALWAPAGVVYLGAKTAAGYGQAQIDAGLDPAANMAALEEWTEFLHGQGHDTVLGSLTEVVGA